MRVKLSINVREKGQNPIKDRADCMKKFKNRIYVWKSPEKRRKRENKTSKSQVK